ncbi:MAG TPA: class I SAM-dependent methyltransferase, partial [Deferrisomatales bacterium]|nr:class I SAM-dependent methyltransferase [Deferrisomatales bacterium]
MLWRTRKREAPRPEPIPDVPDPRREPLAYTSPGLEGLTRRLRKDCTYRILDLGSAQGANVEFFSAYSCRIRIVDFHGTVTERQQAQEPGVPLDQTLLSDLAADTGPFDVILAWDLLNYLDRPQLARVMARLTHLSRAGTNLLAFMHTQGDIPAHPPAYRILNGKTLSCGSGHPDLRPGPGYSPAELEQLFEGFGGLRAFLLRHGPME